MEDWDEYVENILIKDRNQSLATALGDLETQICTVNTHACTNIDESKWKRTRFYHNGEEQKPIITYGAGK